MKTIKRFGNEGIVETRKSFGNSEVKFDTVMNHDTYSYLRVTVEVARDNTKEAIVLLNGKIVGKLELVPDGRKVGYKTYRRSESTGYYTSHLSHITFSEMGRAIAAIISDFIE